MEQNTIRTTFFKTPFGELILGDFENQLCLCDWRYRKMRKRIDQRIQSALRSRYVEECTELHTETKAQLNAYFEGKQTHFNIPLLCAGTDFQKQVWSALQNIPFGVSSTYLELSRQLGNEKAIRAVASANGANAISIIIPCHRIIGSDGKLVGYAGGLGAKKKLLKLENILPGGQLELF